MSHASENQEYRSSLVGELWLRVSHEARAAVVWRLDWGEEIHFQDGCLTWLLTGGLWVSLCRPFHRTTWLYSTHGHWLLLKWVVWERGNVRAWSQNVRTSLLFYSLEVNHLVQPTLKGKEIKLCLKEWLSNTL